MLIVFDAYVSRSEGRVQTVSVNVATVSGDRHIPKKSAGSVSHDALSLQQVESIFPGLGKELFAQFKNCS